MNLFVHLLLGLVAAAPQAAGAAAPADDLMARDAALNRSILAGDAHAAAGFYLDDFVLTTSGGTRKNKADMLRDVALPALHFEVNETRDVQVRVHDATAVLTALLHQKGTLNGAGFDVELWVTDTWVRVGDHDWMLLAGHASRAPSH